MAAYGLMGHIPVERDDNKGLTMKQQMAGRTPALTEVYETDDIELAKKILKDGYITGPNGEHIVVEEIKMKNLTAGGSTISKSSELS